MSNDGQCSGWTESGGGLESAHPWTVETAGGALPYRPAPIDQLLKWALSTDGQIPKVIGFDCNQAAQLISHCLDSRHQRYGAVLPPLFWTGLKNSLRKAESLWGFVLSGYMGWTMEGLKEDPQLTESVAATANELYMVFHQWVELYADGLNGTGDAVWENVLDKLARKGETLNLVRVNYQGHSLPFFRWEADYHLPGRPQPVTIPSSEIAAWFVLFSLTRVFEQFVFLSDCLIPGTDQDLDQDHTNDLFQYWIDIQDSLTVAEYWYDRLYSLDETLKEFEKRVLSDAESMTLDQLKLPDVSIRDAGLLRLFNWFQNPSSSKAGYRQWQAFWMAKSGQLEPSNDTEWDHEEVRLAMAELRDSFQSAVMKLAFEKACTEFRVTRRASKKWLDILDHKHSSATKENVKWVVQKLIGIDGESLETMNRAFRRFAAYRKLLKPVEKEYRQRLQANKAVVRKNLTAGKITK